MKKIAKYTLRIFIYSLIILIVTEFALRSLGFKPEIGHSKSLLNIKPKSSVKYDPLIGYSFSPGKYKYNYENGYSFTSTHNSFGYRISSKSDSKNQKSINFYGCSFFYGYGLNDSAVFTWKLQKNIPNYTINNCSIYGHNMVTPLILLKDQINKNMLPNIAVISYATFNLDRNVYALRFRKNLRVFNEMIKKNPFYYVYAHVNKNNSKLEIKYAPFSSFSLPYSYSSALINKIEQVYMNIDYNQLQPKTVDSLLIEEYIKLCDLNHIYLIFAFVTKDEQGDKLLSKLKSRGVHCVDLFVDYSNTKYNLMPFDYHPNELAHEEYSSRMLKYLTENGLLK